MKTTVSLLFACSAATLGLSACHNAKSAPEGPRGQQPVAVIPVSPEGRIDGGKHMFLPCAQVYRTNGDYSDNVPIQVSADGKNVISYPAPTDLRESTTPLPLADGWLLDRRGIGENTRFTRYTYAQYMALKEPPTIAELLKAVIPTACITELYSLPCTTQEALADTAAVNRMIRSGFKGCSPVIMQPVVD